MKSRRSELAWIVAALLCAAIPGRADAQEPAEAARDERVVRAREAFRLGTALAKQGQWPEALAAFERSAKLHAHATTTYNIGYCERALGHVTRARTALVLALTGPEAELPDATRALAESYLAEMNTRVARAVVTVRGSGVTLVIDGRPLQREPTSGRPVLVAGTRDPGTAEVVERGSFELVADPGSHVVVVAQDGKTRVLRWQLRAGETSAFEIGEAPRTKLRTPEQKPDRTWAIVAFGVGAAGIAVGATSGVTALREKSSLDERCTDGSAYCDPRYRGDIDNMNRAATVSTIAFGIGAAGLGAGIYLWLSGSAREPAMRARLGPGSVALQTGF